MPKEFLDRPDVVAGFKQMSGKECLKAWQLAVSKKVSHTFFSGATCL